MRIGIEAQRLFRKKKHGMDIVALELIKALQKLETNHQFYVYVKPDSDDQVIQSLPNFDIVKVKYASYPVWEQWNLPKAARGHKLDLLHSTSNTAPLNCPASHQVITLHDIIYLERLNLQKGTWYQRIGNLYRRWNVPRVVQQAQKIITVSDFERKRILDYFNLPGDRVVTVHNAVGSHFKPETDAERIAAIKKKYNLPEQFMFFLGNTDPKKNVRGVLQALSILKKENKLTLPLVITDIDRQYIQQLLQTMNATDLEKDIITCGYVPNKQLPVLYSCASLFLYPSLRESFGIPLLEAMACGVPVVTSNTSAMPEVAADAALFADPYLPEEIAQQVEMLMSDTEKREQMREKGLLRASQFSWEKTAEKVLKLYEGIV